MAKPKRKVVIQDGPKENILFVWADEAAASELPSIEGIDHLIPPSNSFGYWWVIISPLYDVAEVRAEIEALGVPEPIPDAFTDEANNGES